MTYRQFDRLTAEWAWDEASYQTEISTELSDLNVSQKKHWNLLSLSTRTQKKELVDPPTYTEWNKEGALG